jgi:ribosomal protein S14
MLSAKIKDLKSRKIFENSEKSQKVGKFLFINSLNNKTVKNVENLSTVFYLQSCLGKKKSKVKITRRCVINNRNRSVVRPFGISRVYLRELLQFGGVPGYSKAVW